MKRLAAAIFLALLISCFWFSSSGYAACFSPAGNAGDVIYYGRYQSDMYCDGGAWVSMGGPVGNTTTGLLGWWKLDDGAGTSAIDSSGNSHTGTLTNSPTWTTGINGKALAFVANKYVTMGDINAMDSLGAVTVSTWIKSSAAGANAGAGSERTIVSKSNCSGATNDGPFELMVSNAGSEKASFAVYPAGGIPGGVEISPDSTTNVDDGYWHFIAGEYDGANVSIWVDGALQNSTAIGAVTLSSTAIPSFEINGCGHSWSGIIDDVRVYGRALSAQDISTLVYSTGPLSGDINTGLIHYWKLDEAPGATAAVDAVGGLTLTATGSPTFAAGQINNAGSFPSSGTNYFHSAGPTGVGSKSAVTLSAWYKLNDTSTAGATIGQMPGTGAYMSMEYYPGTLYVQTDNSYVGSVNMTTDTNWHLMTMVFDGTQSAANRLKAYIDGAQQTLTFTAFPLTTTDPTDDFGIEDTGGQHALVDEVRVYNRALTDADVATLYVSTALPCASPVGYTGDLLYNSASHVPQFCNGGRWIPVGPVPGTGGSGCTGPAGSEGSFVYNADNHVMQFCDGTNWVATGGTMPVGNGLVGWWNLDEGSGTSVADSSGNGSTGTLHGSPLPTWNASGKFNSALNFNGSAIQYVDVGNAAALNFDRLQPLSITAWINVTSGFSNFGDIFAKQNATSSPFQNFQFFAYGGNDALAFEMVGTADAGTGIQVLTPPGSLTFGTWQHVAVTYDGSSHAAGVNMYINGVLQTPLTVDYDSLTSTIITSADATIASNGAGFQAFEGAIDDVRVYNRVLSAAEIWSLYNGAP